MFCYHLYGAGSRFTTNQAFTSAVEESGLLDQDDTSLIFPSLLTNAPQKVKCINSYFVISCSTLCINFNIL